MEGEFRNLIVSIIMISVVFAGIMMFLSSFVASNGGSIPSNINNTLGNLGHSLNGQSTAIGNSLNSTSSNVQSLLGGGNPNLLSSIAATFVVFGGIVVALFSYLAMIPLFFFEIFALFTNPAIDPFAGIATILIIAGSSMILLTMVFALIRAITKEDV
jgi:hypothetical protein